MVALAREYRDFLAGCTLCATGTTGGRLQDEVGLEVERLLSGPLHLLAFTPRGLTSAEADGWSAQTRQQLLERQLMLSRPLHAGRHHLKAVLGNPYTAEAQLQAIAGCVAESLTPLAVSAQP